MVTESKILAMRSRINTLEIRLEYLYKRLHMEYSDDPDAANREVLALIVRGNMIEAVKRYREIHNVGLAEAKKAVDAMEAGLGL